MSILLKNAGYIDWQTLEFFTTNIFIQEGTGGKIFFFDNLENIKANKVIDCQGKFVTKSFAIGHHHIYSALARGMPAPKKQPENFLEILKYIWWNLDKVLDKEMIEASALSTAIACAKSGSTFVIDHHASPGFIEGSLEVISKAFEKVGISHLLCYEITDRDGMDKAEKGLDETENFLQNKQGLIGLHASFTVGKETMRKSVDLMNRYNSGIHIHVAEDYYDQKHSLENYGKRVVERLNDYGILDSSKTILGHCLHIDNNERKLIRESKSYVVQNTESNLNNNVGYFNSAGLGENIFLGTDGMHSDMMRSVQAAYFVGQGFDNIDFVTAYRRFRNVHRYLDTNNFSGDGENNLIVLDYDTPTEIDETNFLGHFIFGLRERHIQQVISNGKLILENRNITTVDEAEVLKFSREQGKKLWRHL